MATTRPFQDVLFTAIQTVPQKKDFEELSPRLQAAWVHKSGFLRTDNDDNLSPEDLYAKRAALYAEFGKVVNITAGYYHKTDKDAEPELRVKTLSSADDERELLINFKNLLNERFDQNRLRLCAHNGKEFDFPYLSRRMLLHCVPIPEALNFAGKKPWEVPHLDTMEMWMFGNRKYFVTLELLAAIFDIPVQEPTLEGAETGKEFYKEGGMEKLEERGRQEVITTAQLYMRYHCSPLLQEHQIILV